MEELVSAWHKADDWVGTWHVQNQPLIDDYPLLFVPFVVGYVIFVFAGPIYMANRKPFGLTWTIRLWNLFLTLLSLWMFVAMGVPAVKFLLKNGLRVTICAATSLPGVSSGWSFFALWVFTMSKFFELFDTVLLVAKKKPVIFLHWYHHTTVLSYTYFCMYIHAPPGLVFGSINSLVHTFMYFYYFAVAMRWRLPKGYDKFVTTLQLSQMVVGIATTGLWFYYYYTGYPVQLQERVPDAPRYFVIASMALYGSYFLLFLQFYLQRYVFSAPKQNAPQEKPKSQ